MPDDYTYHVLKKTKNQNRCSDISHPFMYEDRSDAHE